MTPMPPGICWISWKRLIVVVFFCFFKKPGNTKEVRLPGSVVLQLDCLNSVSLIIQLKQLAITKLPDHISPNVISNWIGVVITLANRSKKYRRYLSGQTWSFVSHRNPRFLKSMKSAAFRNLQKICFQNLLNLRFFDIEIREFCGFCNHEVQAFHQVRSFKRKTNQILTTHLGGFGRELWSEENERKTTEKNVNVLCALLS